MKTQRLRGFTIKNTVRVNVHNKKEIQREGILTCVANNSALNGLFQDIHGGRDIIQIAKMRSDVAGKGITRE